MRNVIIILTIFLCASANAGQSFFGISDKGLGFLTMPYSGAGFSRSYETASDDTLLLNFTNFSYWSNISRTSYTTFLDYKTTVADDGIKNDYITYSGNFRGGFLAVPIYKKKLAIGIGMQPITRINQKYVTTNTDSLEEDREKHLYMKGGLSRATVNIAYNVLPHTGVGLGYEYTFGKITDNFRIVPSGASTPSIFLDVDYRFYGHGLVFSANTRAIKNLNIGLQVRSPVMLTSRIKPSSGSTAINESRLKKLTLPALFNFGAEYDIGKRWSTGFDVIYQDWKNGYKIEDKTVGNFHDIFYRVGFGVEHTQSEKLFTEAINKLDYRFGVFYSNLNQTSADNQVKEYGVSFGVSLPIVRFRSRVDLSGVIGKRGDIKVNAYEETFFNFGITISVNETWYIKYDD